MGREISFGGQRAGIRDRNRSAHVAKLRSGAKGILFGA